MKEVFKFLGGLGAIVGGVMALVFGTMAVMTIWISSQAAGLVWCGFMFLTLLVGASWWVYEDSQRERRLNVERSLYLTRWYSARL